MSGHNDPEESGWTLLANAIAVLLGVSAAAQVVAMLARKNLPLLLVIIILGLLALHNVGHRGHHLVGGRPWRWLRRPPRPLSGDVRWGGLATLWRAGWIGRHGCWPVGVYRTLGGVLRVTVRIPEAAATQGTLVLAPTGGGKTDSVLVPIVRSEARITRPARRHSLIVLDPKGDVLEKARDALQATHDVLVWNPAEPHKSTVAIDPLRWIPHSHTDPRYQEACDNVARAYLAATYSDETGATSSYVADPYWQKQVSSVFKGLLLYLKALNAAVTLLDVARYLAEVTPEEMVRHLTTHPRTAGAELRGASFRELLLNERARGAVVGDLIERCALLTDVRLGTVLAPGALPAFDLDAFLARPTVLALQVGALGDSMLPLLSVVLATIQTELIRRTRGGGRLSRGVRIIVDEAGVIGRISGLDSGIAMMRSADVGYLIALQATDQLRAAYGKDRTDTILKNLAHRIALGGTADDDAEWICRNLGKRHAYRDLPGTNGTGEESWHYTREEWPLLRPDQLRRMRFQAVVDSSHLPPLRLRLRRDKSPH